MSATLDDGVIATNPASKLRRSLGLVVSSKQRSEQIKAFTEQELAAFLRATKSIGIPYGPLLRTLALTGLRLGEGLGLQWPDVNFEQGTVRVERAVSHGGYVDVPKSGFGRTVDMGPELAQTLLRLRMRSAERMKRHGWETLPPWVFAIRTGEPPDPQHVRAMFRKVLRAAGLPRRFTPHCLRHTFASLLLQRGESAQWVQQQLGHASIQLTVDTYGKWLPKRPLLGGVKLLEGLTGSKLVAGLPKNKENLQEKQEFLV
jgi:integrase